jgi:hypothetical protein
VAGDRNAGVRADERGLVVRDVVVRDVVVRDVGFLAAGMATSNSDRG